MTSSVSVRRCGVRRSLYCAFAGGATAAVVAVLSLPPATAATDPCAASEIAGTIGAVSNSTGSYLDVHPQNNAALSSQCKLPLSGPQALQLFQGFQQGGGLPGGLSAPSPPATTHR